MLVPTFEETKVINTDGDKEGWFTDVYRNLFVNLLQQMQLSVGNEGYLIPSLNASERTQIQSTFGTNGGAQAGTLIFGSDIINGGSSMQPNGQLMVLLGDGTFHPVTNT